MEMTQTTELLARGIGLHMGRGSARALAWRACALLLVVSLFTPTASFSGRALPMPLRRHPATAHTRPATTMLAGGDLLIVGAGTLGMRLVNPEPLPFGNAGMEGF